MSGTIKKAMSFHSKDGYLDLLLFPNNEPLVITRESLRSVEDTIYLLGYKIEYLNTHLDLSYITEGDLEKWQQAVISFKKKGLCIEKNLIGSFFIIKKMLFIYFLSIIYISL